MSTRSRILTGDTPTGRLHLGHWVGSLENRVRLQDQYDCFFLVANMHAFTTRADQAGDIRRDTLEIVKDWLAAGIDPERSTIVLQTEIPAIAELSWYFAMLTPFNRVMRNPTLKTELELKDLGDHYSFGFPLYAVGQCADILAFRGDLVPVGEDQVAHIEMCREVARRFNWTYCGVDPATKDEEHLAAGGLFPIPNALVGRVGRLVGTDGKNKMSKSLGNAILLTDTAKDIKKKMGALYTGRQSMTEPATSRTRSSSTCAPSSRTRPRSPSSKTATRAATTSATATSKPTSRQPSTSSSNRCASGARPSKARQATSACSRSSAPTRPRPTPSPRRRSTPQSRR
ncbi:MAG: tryptophan--tRNA ligase [Polyangiaceae bacterium]